MGYYNPVLIYGEERLIEDCKTVGVNGFIICDLPPEEAIKFRAACTKGGYDTNLAFSAQSQDMGIFIDFTQNLG